MAHLEFAVLLTLLLSILWRLPTPWRVEMHLKDAKQQLDRIQEIQVEQMDLLCSVVDHLQGADAAVHVLKLNKDLREKMKGIREEWRHGEL